MLGAANCKNTSIVALYQDYIEQGFSIATCFKQKRTACVPHCSTKSHCTDTFDR